MLTVLIGNSITIEWTLRGANLGAGFVKGAFFVYSGITRIPVDYEISVDTESNDVLSAVVPTGNLPAGVYSLEFVYTKSGTQTMEFSESVEYAKGVLVMRNMQLYQFVRPHIGTWDSGDVEPIPMNYGRLKQQRVFELTENVSRSTPPSSVITVESAATVIGADGLSAYDLAVLQGYAGSLEEYVELYKNAADLLREKVEAVDSDEVVDDIEDAVVTNAIRKTAQTLTDDEQKQARENIGASYAFLSVFIGDEIGEVDG